MTCDFQDSLCFDDNTTTAGQLSSCFFVNICAICRCIRVEWNEKKIVSLCCRAIIISTRSTHCFNQFSSDCLKFIFFLKQTLKPNVVSFLLRNYKITYRFDVLPKYHFLRNIWDWYTNISGQQKQIAYFLEFDCSLRWILIFIKQPVKKVILSFRRFRFSMKIWDHPEMKINIMEISTYFFPFKLIDWKHRAMY